MAGFVTEFVRKNQEHIKENRRSFILYSILRALVILTLIRCLWNRNYESAFLCVLSLFLFLMPAFLERKLRIKFPPLFEAMIYIFIYAAEILGEINHYYVLIPMWDTMLHTVNGFLCAAIGFSLIDVLNRNSKRMELSPIYLSLVAFCFSMTIGVLWEFFEFGMDQMLLFDMQKDFVVTQLGSVTLDPNQMGTAIQVREITDTVIHTASGQEYIVEGGYLDIGIIDTMKDLWVNFIGAAAFSTLGFFYVAHRDKKTRANAVTESLIIRVTDEEK